MCQLDRKVGGNFGKSKLRKREETKKLMLSRKEFRFPRRDQSDHED
jgi:hypothetical protein